MQDDLKGVWEHMRELGLCALQHAFYHAALYSMENPRWADLSVLQAAHAAELLVKARIAFEHPLLIFSKIPEPQADSPGVLDFDSLFASGLTVQWNELPGRLWATTGISLNKGQFLAFGRFRNAIQHFAPPLGQNASDQTLDFIFRVLDPFLYATWDLCAIDFHEDHEDQYVIGAVVRRELPFHMSKRFAECFEHWDVDWNGVSQEYREQLRGDVQRVLADTTK